MLLGAQVLEEGLVAGGDEDRQSCSTVFACHGRFLRMRPGAWDGIIIEHVRE
jgi:hypothetical protein